MKADRLARLTPILIVPVAALALAAPATASAQVTAATSARPALNSAVAGFVWSGSTAPSGHVSAYYSYDSVGGHVSVTTSSPGVYVATFPGLGSVARKAIVQVSAYGTGDTCAVVGWGKSGSNLTPTSTTRPA